MSRRKPSVPKGRPSFYCNVAGCRYNIAAFKLGDDYPGLFKTECHVRMHVMADHSSHGNSKESADQADDPYEHVPQAQPINPRVHPGATTNTNDYIKTYVLAEGAVRLKGRQYITLDQLKELSFCLVRRC